MGLDRIASKVGQFVENPNFGFGTPDSLFAALHQIRLPTAAAYAECYSQCFFRMSLIVFASIVPLSLSGALLRLQALDFVTREIASCI